MFRNRRWLNTLEQLALSGLIKKLKNRRFGSTKIKILSVPKGMLLFPIKTPMLRMQPVAYLMGKTLWELLLRLKWLRNVSPKSFKARMEAAEDEEVVDPVVALKIGVAVVVVAVARLLEMVIGIVQTSIAEIKILPVALFVIVAKLLNRAVVEAVASPWEWKPPPALLTKGLVIGNV